MIKTIPNINRKALRQVMINKSNAKELINNIDVSKRIKSINEFPDYAKVKLDFVINYLVNEFNPDKIYLTGSYAYGLWVDEKKTEEINRSPNKKGKSSDFDVILFPEPKQYRIIDTEFGKIDILYDSGRRYKILIYDNQVRT